MVAFDDSGSACTGLDHIGVDGALGKIVHRAELSRFFLKDPDKFFSDDLALAFRVGLTGQLGQEPALRIDTDKVHGPSCKGRLDLVSLV